MTAGVQKSRRSGRLPAEKAAMIPDRLLDAATELFGEGGYARTTMDGIARKARASTKTVYSRYPGKERILAAVVRRLMDRAIASETAMVADKTDNKDPRAFLLWSGRQLAALSAAKETVGLNRLILSESPQFPELARLFVDLHERAIAFISEPLQIWREAGYLPYISDTKLAATMFIEMAASVPRLHALLGKPLSPGETETLIATAVDLFLRGCGFTFDEPGSRRWGRADLRHDALTRQIAPTQSRRDISRRHPELGQAASATPSHEG